VGVTTARSDGSRRQLTFEARAGSLADMTRRPLGKTGLGVSPISFGAFKIGRNQKIKYAEGYALPTDEEVGRLLNGVLDLGINLIDTAPAYGISEERIGAHISHRRGEYLLSSKVGETFEAGESRYDFSREGTMHSVHRSLRRLKTEVLDFVFIHSDGRDFFILEQTDVVGALEDLKQQGLIRHIGLSGKAPEAETVAMKWADALMVEYHPDERSHESVITEARERGVGVLVKKPLASGHITPEKAIPFLLENPGVSTLVIGGLNLEHIRHNVQIAP
jgi:aryl-alcohol dehydrogenase-like predicted oxidoreductase